MLKVMSGPEKVVRECLLSTREENRLGGVCMRACARACVSVCVLMVRQLAQTTS